MNDETLEGVLTDIRYHGDGFLIGRLGQGATVKGQLISPKIGMGYIFKGHWEDHPKFGRGFKFEEYETVYPTSSKAIQEYLVENAEGIGPKIAEKLTEAFQEYHANREDHRGSAVERLVDSSGDSGTIPEAEEDEEVDI